MNRANILRRADIIRVLTDAGVNFDSEATIVQLRPLYDEIMERNARNAADNVFFDANNAPEVNREPGVQQTVPGNARNVQNDTDENEVDRQIALLRKKRELMQLQSE